jgi:hypothetical protein
MRTKLSPLLIVLAIVVVGTSAGCPRVVTTGGSGEVTADFELGEGLRSFQVQAGEPTENFGTGTFTIAGGEVTAGVLVLDPANVIVTPAAGGPDKSQPTMQAGEELVITVWIDAPENEGTVCDDGEQYGPFTVVLDENYVPVSVDPAEVTLSEATVALINAGEFSICIRVLSTITGTVEITALTFTLS